MIVMLFPLFPLRGPWPKMRGYEKTSPINLRGNKRPINTQKNFEPESLPNEETDLMLNKGTSR
jgi:hypothetical protein